MALVAGGSISEFDGVPPAALTFYQGLRQDNSKVSWEANKPIWEAEVLAPLQRVPRQYAADCPRGDWLKWKGMGAGREFGAPPRWHTPQARTRIIERY